MNVARHEGHDRADAQDNEHVRARRETITEDPHESRSVDRHERVDRRGEKHQPDGGRAVEVAQLLDALLVQEFGELRRDDDAQGRIDDHARLNETDRTAVDTRGSIAREQADQQDVQPLQGLLETGSQGARQGEGDDLTTTLRTRPAPLRVRHRRHVPQQQPPRRHQHHDEGQCPRD